MPDDNEQQPQSEPDPPEETETVNSINGLPSVWHGIPPRIRYTLWP